MERSEKGVIRGYFRFRGFFGFQIRLTGLCSDTLRPSDEIDVAIFVFGLKIFQERKGTEMFGKYWGLLISACNRCVQQTRERYFPLTNR